MFGKCLVDIDQYLSNICQYLSMYSTSVLYGIAYLPARTVRAQGSTGTSLISSMGGGPMEFGRHGANVPQINTLRTCVHVCFTYAYISFVGGNRDLGIYGLRNTEVCGNDGIIQMQGYRDVGVRGCFDIDIF